MSRITRYQVSRSCIGQLVVTCSPLRALLLFVKPLFGFMWIRIRYATQDIARPQQIFELETSDSTMNSVLVFGGWCPTHSGIALKSPYTWEGWWGLFWVCLFQLQEGEDFTAATSGGLLIAGKSSWPSYMFTFKLFLSIPIYSIRSYIQHCRHHRRWLHYVTLWLYHFQEMPLYQKNPRGCGPGKSKCIETRDLGVCLGTWSGNSPRLCILLISIGFLILWPDVRHPRVPPGPRLNTRVHHRTPASPHLTLRRDAEVTVCLADGEGAIRNASARLLETLPGWSRERSGHGQ